MTRRDVEGFAVAGFGFGVLSLLMGDPTQLVEGESLKRLVVSSLQKAEFHLVTRPGPLPLTSETYVRWYPVLW
jgi:hypothetical protein